MSMAREIRRLDPSHIDAYTDIAFNAYPSFKDFSAQGLEEYKKEAVFIMENDPVVTFYGMFEGEKLVAVMRLFDFQMNCFGKLVAASGLGFLGVHLMHKKQGIAKEMVDFYEGHYIDRKMPIGLLLPFRPDFYKRMGYGLGTKMNQYRLPPARINVPPSEKQVRYVREDELSALLALHSSFAEKTHGMMIKFGDEIRPIFGDPFNRVVGVYGEDSALTGYMVYRFKNAKDGNYTITNLIVKELIYLAPDDLHALLGYLKNQGDQIHLIVFNTEDEHFYHLFDNPLNDTLNYIPYGYLETNTQAIGAMYKVFDVKEAFRQCSHRDYNGVSLRVRFVIRDNYRGDLLEDVRVDFVEGKAVVVEGAGESGAVVVEGAEVDVVVRLSIADFSTLFLGISSACGLHQLGLLELESSAGAAGTESAAGLASLAVLDRAFYYWQKPVCYTDF